MKEEILNMTWQQFDSACQQIASYINTMQIKIDSIYGLPKGGIPLAIKLCHLLNEKPKLLLDEYEIGYHSIIVDDIVDSGAQLSALIKRVSSRLNNTKLTVATLVYNKHSIIVPDIWVYEKGKQWCTFPWEKTSEEEIDTPEWHRLWQEEAKKLS